VHVPLDDLPHLDPAVADVARTDFKRLRGHLYIQATYKVLAMLFEGVTERVYGRTFALRGLARDPPSFTLAMASTRSGPRPSSAVLSPDAQPSNYASTAQGPLFLAQSPSYSSVMSGLGSPPTRTSTSLSAQPGLQELESAGSRAHRGSSFPALDFSILIVMKSCAGVIKFYTHMSPFLQAPLPKHCF